MRFDAHTHFVSVADAIGGPGLADPRLRARLDPDAAAGGARASGRWRTRLERRALTTVGHWRSYGSIHHDGVHYGQKAHSLRPLIDLPNRDRAARSSWRSRIHPDEVDDLAALRDNGWTLLDPAKLARDTG